ncbi:unnamed protein product, partial [Iphiclides podalirius]
MFLAIDADVRLEEELKHLMTRVKRNVNEKFENKRKNNGTVKFYHTVDELNEDTLKNSNISGTIEATKVVGVKVPKISRRTSAMDSKNVTGISDLHIEFNQPKDYDHQIVDNKIDSPTHIASGNISLAKELFSAFIENSGKAPSSNSSPNYFEASSNSNNRPKKTPSEIFNTFENDNRMSDVELKMHDNFLKQLLKLKTMNA